MQDPMISVIVPVYNVEMYLAACLDSIINQSYRNIEIIVINDGSTDFSGKIAETYAEKEDRLTVYTHENEGLSQARNRGLSVATGDLVTFVDSDDLLLPGALEILADTMAKTGADLVEGSFLHGKVVGEISFSEKIHIESYTPIEAIADVLYQKRLLPSACGKLYKRALFDGLTFEKGILYEDLDIFYRVLERCKKIVWISRPVYFYRVNSDSIINSWKPQRLDVLKVTENIENYIQENYPQLLASARDRRLSANFNMFILCSKNGDHESATKCWEIIKKNRKDSLFNRNVRIKNKAGVLLSYLGKRVFRIVGSRMK